MRNMDQRKPQVDLLNPHAGQFLYLGRWVNKEHFRAFVYDKDGNEKLADNYPEFEKLTVSGIWFASKQEANHASLPKIKGKLKDDVTLPNGK